MPDIYKVIDDVQRDLDLRDQILLHRVSSLYHSTAANILSDLKPLQKQIADARAMGIEVSKAWLIRERRLSSLLDQVRSEMRKFSAQAISLTHGEQQEQARDSVAHVIRMMDVQTPNGVYVAFNRLSTRAVEKIVGATSPGSPLRKLFDELGEGTSKRVVNELVQGVVLGLSTDKTARRISAFLEGNKARAQTIARTETIRAYRESGRQTAIENQDILEGWTWVSALVGSCAACVAMHGTKHPVEERMASHPNCFPAGTIVSGPKVKAVTTRWYAGEVVELETINGRHLTVTPNHPILTLQGWVAAAFLNEGSHVLSCLNAERIPVGGADPNNYQVPTLIEDVANSCGESVFMTSVSVPVAAEDFHGDGRGSEVCIVRTDRELRGGLDTEIAQPGSHQIFGGTDVYSLTLPSLRALDQFGLGSALTAHRLMGASDIFPILLGRPCAHHQAIGVSARPNRYTLLDEATPNYATIDAEALCDSILGFAGAVASSDRGIGQNVLRSSSFPDYEPIGAGHISDPDTTRGQLSFEGTGTGVEFARDLCRTFPGLVRPDRIIKASRRDFVGHVYNLQTEDGWYLSNGIVTHNCRCVQQWTTKSWEELGLGGIPETGPTPVEPGAAWFARQPEKMQLEVLGKAGFNAYRSGRVKLEHFVGTTQSPQWGKSFFQQSLKAALAEARREGYGVAAGGPLPSSIAIGPKIQISQPEKGKHLARVLGLIDDLHGDGPLHDLPVRFANDPINMGSFWRTNPPHATAQRITISTHFPSISGQEFTFAHELGHYLDLQGMRSKTGWFGSEAKDFSPSMTKLFDLLLDSPEIKAIKASKRSNHRNYLLRRREIWARAYAQYVATRTGDPGLLAGLEDWRTMRGINGFAQWTDDSFEPIMKTIDELFLELGWLKHQP